MYRAIVSVDGENSKVLSGETPAALGEAIGEAIAADPLGAKADVVYEFTGPISRRMSNKKDEDPENPELP